MLQRDARGFLRDARSRNPSYVEPRGILIGNLCVYLYSDLTTELDQRTGLVCHASLACGVAWHQVGPPDPP